jgi:hypothetical protein
MIKRLFGGFSYNASMSTNDIAQQPTYQINISLPPKDRALTTGLNNIGRQVKPAAGQVNFP